MNRTEWEASNDPLPMLDWLRQRGSERKLRLFACACMVGAGLVLLSTNRRFARSAAIQAVPPLVAIVAAFLVK